jgi:hypothetical protein
VLAVAAFEHDRHGGPQDLHADARIHSRIGTEWGRSDLPSSSRTGANVPSRLSAVAFWRDDLRPWKGQAVDSNALTGEERFESCPVRSIGCRRGDKRRVRS